MRATLALNGLSKIYIAHHIGIGSRFDRVNLKIESFIKTIFVKKM